MSRFKIKYVNVNNLDASDLLGTLGAYSSEDTTIFNMKKLNINTITGTYATFQNITINTGSFTSIIFNSMTGNAITSNTGIFNNLAFNVATGNSINVNSVTSNTGIFNYLRATNITGVNEAFITDLTVTDNLVVPVSIVANTGEFNYLRVLSVFTGHDGSFDDLEVESLRSVSFTGANVYATGLSIVTLTGTNAFISSISGNNFNSNFGYINNLTGINLWFGTGTITNIIGTNANIMSITGVNNLTVGTGTITNIIGTNANITSITGTSAFISLITGNTGSFNTLSVRDNISISSITGNMSVGNIQTTTVEQDDLVLYPLLSTLNTAQATLNPSTSNYYGATFIVLKACSYNKMVFRTGAVSAANTGYIAIYQRTGGKAATSTNLASLISTSIVTNPAANTTQVVQMTGTNNLSPGVAYVLVGKFNNAATPTLNFTAYGVNAADSLNANLATNTAPLTFITSISTNSPVPSTFDPVTQTASTLNTSIICRLINT